jgi:hypothetical protein
VPIAYARCDVIAQLTHSTPSGCVDGQAYRVVDSGRGAVSNELHPGTVLTVPAGTNTRMLKVPAQELVLNISASPLVSQSIVVTSSAPRGGWPAETVFTFRLPMTDAAIGAFQDRLATVSLGSATLLQSTDLVAMRTYKIHSAIVGLSISIGFLLGVVAFCVACIDRARERRRNVAALFAIGVSRATLVRAEAWQLTLPAVFGLSLAAVVGHFVGTAYLVGGGLQQGWYAGSLRAGLVLMVLGSVLAFTSSVVLRAHIRAENLRSE